MQDKKFFVVMELDNVVYDFSNYYLDMIEFIASFVNENFGLNKDEFIDKFIFKMKDFVFTCNDYLYVTAEVLREYDNTKTMNFSNVSSKISFINSLRIRFNQSRIKYLKFIPGILLFLSFVKNNGGCIVGFTNSPSRLVKQRLKLLDIDKYFEDVYCLQDSFSAYNGKYYDLSDGDSISSIWYYSICNNVSSLMCDVIEFPIMYQKPSRRGLQRILEEEGIPEDRVIVIGNSVENDILTAKFLKLRAVLLDYKPKIRNKFILQKLLKEIPVKHLRKIINLPNNKKFMKENLDLVTISSFSEFVYSKEIKMLV
ncbi:MAG: hypothetical protein ACK4F9_07165 [Brevinematia bacterium]